MNNELIQALNMLEAERGIKKEYLVETIEAALVSAYKKNYDGALSARVELNLETGDIKVFSAKTVAGEIEDVNNEIGLDDALELNPSIALGEIVEIEVTPDTFGRLAAQTAKQVIVQRLREAERGIIFDEYSERTNEVVTATVQRIERNNIYVELNKAEAILPANETLPNEILNPNDRIKVFICDVKKMLKGPQIIVSRTHPGLIKRLFELEVPEIASEIVTIKSVAREAGYRTKVAVSTNDENVDPVGACVGPKGGRIEKIVAELNNEKIDIIPWSINPVEYIANALRPAKVIMVQINEEEKAAKVVVPDAQLSLAIGREGQNARLAVKLTGWKIDIKSQKMMNEMFENMLSEDEEYSNEEYSDDEYLEYPEEEMYGENGEYEENTDSAMYSVQGT